MLRFLCSLMMALWVMHSPAHATTALYLTEAEQSQLSTAVVIANVMEQNISVHPRWQRPITQTRIDVIEVITGEAPDVLFIEQLGGTLNGQTLYVPGDARLETGEQCVLFLKEIDGQWFLTAMEQSRYTITPSPLGDLLEQDLSDGLFVRNDQGQLQPYSAPTDSPVLTLDALRRRITESEVTP